MMALCRPLIPTFINCRHKSAPHRDNKQRYTAQRRGSGILTDVGDQQQQNTNTLLVVILFNFLREIYCIHDF